MKTIIVIRIWLLIEKIINYSYGIYNVFPPIIYSNYENPVQYNTIQYNTNMVYWTKKAYILCQHHGLGRV